MLLAPMDSRKVFPSTCGQASLAIVWLGHISYHPVSPGPIYLTFLQEILPELLEDVPLDIRQHMWFQHDGAPAHFSLAVREYANQTFGDRWIGRGGPVAWPPRSPDLTPLDFFLWGHIKALVYATPIETVEDLVARILAAAEEVQNMPGIFERIQRNMLRRCNSCIEVDGGHFEQLL